MNGLVGGPLLVGAPPLKSGPEVVDTRVEVAGLRPPSWIRPNFTRGQRRREVDGGLVDVVADVVRGRRHRRQSGSGQRVVRASGAVADVAEPRGAAADQAPRPPARLTADRQLVGVGPLDPERRRQLQIRAPRHCTAPRSHTTMQS